MAEDLDGGRGQYAGQIPQEIESWSRAVVHVEAARSRVPLQKLAVAAIPSLAELKRQARKLIAFAGSVGGDSRIVPQVYPALFIPTQNIAVGIAPGRTAGQIVNRQDELRVGVGDIPPEDANILAYAMIANNLLASSDKAAIVLRSPEVRSSNDAVMYYHPLLTEIEKEQAADDALESLKAMGPVGLVGIEYLRAAGVKFERTATGAAGVLVTDQTIFGGTGGGAGGAFGPGGQVGALGQQAGQAVNNQWDAIPMDLAIRRNPGDVLDLLGLPVGSSSIAKQRSRAAEAPIHFDILRAMRDHRAVIQNAASEISRLRVNMSGQIRGTQAPIHAPPTLAYADFGVPTTPGLVDLHLHQLT